MRSKLLAPLPMFAVLLLTLLAVLPWGGPDWLEMSLALLTVGCIYFWSLRRPRLMPAVLVFLMGLLLDAMTHGPLGVWAAAALVAALSGRLARQSQMSIGWVRGSVYIVAMLAFIAAFVAVVASLHAGQLLALRPITDALIAACLTYPLLAAILSVVDRAWFVRDGRSLFLRGD